MHHGVTCANACTLRHWQLQTYRTGQRRYVPNLRMASAATYHRYIPSTGLASALIATDTGAELLIDPPRAATVAVTRISSLSTQVDRRWKQRPQAVPSVAAGLPMQERGRQALFLSLYCVALLYRSRRSEIGQRPRSILSIRMLRRLIPRRRRRSCAPGGAMIWLGLRPLRRRC
jgi:hypothetical protein